jgi:hypothetical protein
MTDNRNPYIQGFCEPQLRNSVVVFMDILGYRDIVEQSAESGPDEKMFQRLHSALKASKNELMEDASISIGNKDCYAVKAFTDNIVIGWPIRDDAEAELVDLFSSLSLFQLDMTLAGFFIRGGISIGPLYMDDIAVFGKGLIEAHKGESQLARDPRIVLTHSADIAIRKHIDYYTRPEESPQNRDLYKDTDGQVFLNYLETVLLAEDEYGPFYDRLLAHKKVVESKLIEYEKSPTIWSKYAWVANYHNFFCDQYPGYFDDSHKIDDSIIRLIPTRIK